MFKRLEKINARPKPFEFYTANELWADAHSSQKMLEHHLNFGNDIASRNAEFIDSSVDWISSHLGGL